MKKERKWLCGILAAVILGNMTGCAEQISGIGPHTYILTLPSSMGAKSSFLLVRVL